MVSNKPQHTTPQYLTGLLRHDPAILQSIFREYLPGILQFVKQNKGTAQDAEDIFMDALEAIFRMVSRKGLKDLSCTFYTFLFEICKRLWFRKLRRKKFYSGVIPEDLIVFTGEMDPQTALEEGERHSLFWEKFTLLGKDCQRVLELTLVAKKNAEEIAEIMGYGSAGYVRQKRLDCKEQWKRFLEADPRFKELRITQS